MSLVTERSNRLRHVPLGAVISTLFLLASFFILDDYGLNIDSHKNFLEGENNVTYLLSGQADPKISRNQTHGALMFMLADASRRMFSEGLNLLDPVASRHMILPLLIAAFIPALLWFLTRNWDLQTAVTAVIALLTFPSFFGHAFNNLKDIPLVIFFSLAIMSYAEWNSTRRLQFLYGFFVFLGVALSIKLYALLVPVILFLWLGMNRVSRSEARQSGRRQQHVRSHYLIGTLIMLSIVLICYMPSFWALDSKLEFLQWWAEGAKRISLRPQGSWDGYAFQQVLYRTPAPMLMFAGLGLAMLWRHRERTAMNSLLALWLALPLVMACLPYLFRYHNGMRLFLVFVAPFSIVAGCGVTWVAEIVSKQFTSKAGSVAALVAGSMLVLSGNLWALVSTHPYQITYFNLLAGGLKGAQEQGIRWSCDYWLHSYKEAGKWLDRHAAPGANVIAVYGVMPSQSRENLMRSLLTREDVHVLRVGHMPNPGRIPRNTYLVFIPFHYYERPRKAIVRHQEFQPVFQITRQDGEILTIYHKP